jgi:tyrosyl-tRNA synthetase
MSLFKELRLRGLIKQTTSPEVEKILNGSPIAFYCGFDPTSDSLHVGSLLPLITMKRLQNFGHQPLALVGGATGFVGDPSFKKDERPPLSEETIKKNLLGISKNIHQIIPSAKMVNNFDWISKISLLDFLKLQGKCFSVNAMLTRDSVKDRLEDPNRGISFTEFTYQLIQGEDFRHLFLTEQCLLQVGGSDQWSNILSGIELIRKTTGKEAFGLTIPLLIKSDGSKFGKSEKGNVWLDSNKTSVFDFFQFFIKADDKDVINLLKQLTFLSLEKIALLEEELNEHPEKRTPQLALAQEVTALVHGKEAMEKALEQTNKLFGRVDISSVQGDVIISTQESQNFTIVELLMKANITTSKGQGRRDILGGGIKVNDIKVTEDRKLTPEEISKKKILLSKGKGLKKIIEIKD